MFYDPYGAPPSIEIRNFVKRRKNAHLGFNNWVIQDLKSENCGYFVLSFLIYLSPKKHTKYTNLYTESNHYLNRFVDDTRNNDKILKLSFRALKKKHPLIQRLYGSI